jgi:uncharacterized protein
MQYAEGQIGRIFVVRIDNGEDLIPTLRQFIEEKDIRAGSMVFLGALMEGKMVTGPEEPVIPPLPHYIFFEGGWEVFGVGTIYPGEGGPVIHYHASVGRAGHALTGCLREKAVTYLIVEAVIYEITGLSARHEFDEKTQIHLPNFRGRAGTGTDGKEPVKEERRPAAREEKSELPGGLAEIIRDLTRRPPA